MIHCCREDCCCKESTFLWESEKRGVLYFEIPRNASSSIKHVLKEDGFVPCRKPYTLRGNSEEWFRFAVVRNPFDRFLSTWWMYCGESGSTKRYFDPDGPSIRGKSRLEFLDLVETNPNHHVLPQSTFLRGHCMDRVLRFERLERDWGLLFSDITLPHHHKTQTKPKVNLTQEEVSRIVEYYRNDFWDFDYPTEWSG